MLRCLVIDDERIAREGLLEFVKQFDFLHPVGDYANALASIDLIKNKEVDLIFLDIEMPGIKGIKFAEMIGDLPVMVIFTTAYPEYALKGYKVNAIGYLLKPIFFEDFEKAVLKAKKWHELMHTDDGESEYLFFKENGVSHRIVVEDIMYVKSLQNYVQLFLKDKRVVIVHNTLKAVQELLPAKKFIQLHRSYLVQKACITSIDGQFAHVHSTALPIARDRKQLLAELLTQRAAGDF
ncbi:LytR/AlgR family response regulator transcription factor [Hymenobacter negativus]|uniref:Response regulator transcription factor n=1 Tax=Hymenobacter negativus TaxID=2795026 RepID=A0ABS3QDJ2_9BACT|nr:LytTR family DNA-binding domain-containing protein [Hymenobacter negativus]MBO2009298.1 response regulator transcription factor [Hymenobacter negativus]